MENILLCSRNMKATIFFVDISAYKLGTVFFHNFWLLCVRAFFGSLGIIASEHKIMYINILRLRLS